MSLFLLIATFCCLAPEAAQAPVTVKELADYRLTLPVLKQVEHSTRLIADAMHDDPQVASDALFTRELMIADDAADAAARLEARLVGEPAFTAALRASNITAREYTTFVLALVAARLAHGFITSGVLRAVPPGAAADNVAFVQTHEQAVAGLLRVMGVETPPVVRRSPAAAVSFSVAPAASCRMARSAPCSDR